MNYRIEGEWCDKVFYIPKHRQDNVTSDDCQPGKVTSINESYIFVKFMDGDVYLENSQACSPSDLKHRL